MNVQCRVVVTFLAEMPDDDLAADRWADQVTEAIGNGLVEREFALDGSVDVPSFETVEVHE